MTVYLLDTNIFIQAKNLYYGFDFCPAFWDWLIERNRAGTVASIEMVADELLTENDDLAAWAKKRRRGFFRRPGSLRRGSVMRRALDTVSVWAQGSSYFPKAVDDFMGVADYWLVAHALAYECTVVTHEKPADTRSRIKIPNACRAHRISCVSPYEMLRHERARFVLR